MNFPLHLKGLQTPTKSGVKSLDRLKAGYSTISNEEYSRNKLPSLKSPEVSRKKEFLLSLGGRKRGMRNSTENPFVLHASLNSNTPLSISKTPLPLPPKDFLPTNLPTPKFTDGFNATFSIHGGINPSQVPFPKTNTKKAKISISRLDSESDEDSDIMRSLGEISHEVLTKNHPSEGNYSEFSGPAGGVKSDNEALKKNASRKLRIFKRHDIKFNSKNKGRKVDFGLRITTPNSDVIDTRTRNDDHFDGSKRVILIRSEDFGHNYDRRSVKKVEKITKYYD